MPESNNDDNAHNGLFNASDPEQVANRKRTQGRKKKSEEGTVKTILSTKDGRAWMLSILEFCHIFAPSYTGEAFSTAFQEGQRNVGLRLLADVTRIAPEEYALMLREKEKHDD